MEELLDLRTAIEAGRYDDALFMIDEMTAMAKKDTINKIGSFVRILLIHLIKAHAEQRMTRSWRNSIKYALEEIAESNQREAARGVYMDATALQMSIEKRFELALDKASEEAFEGVYTARQLAASIDTEAIKAEALHYILNGYPEDEE
jgi:Domain of unknown function DUF29